MLGVSGGANGTGFAAPSTGNVVTPAQIAASNTSANNALAQQQAFTKALGTGGNQGIAAQSSLLGQLQQGAAGQGPNPALAQLNQTTAQNVANQSALMAGQRGASQNAGLIARQAAQQGAATQQQAAGQAATQQAQQQIAYQQALGNQANQMVGQTQGANQAQTQNALQQQLGLSSTAAGLQSSVNSGNTALAGQTMTNQAGLLGGAVSGLGAGFGLLAGGGKVSQAPKMMAQGQYVTNQPDLTDAQWSGQQPLPLQNSAQPAPTPMPQVTASSVPAQAPSNGPQSSFGNFLKSGGQGSPQNQSGAFTAGNAIGSGVAGGLKSLFGSSAPTKGDASESGIQQSLLEHGQYQGQQAEMPYSNDNGPDTSVMAAKGGKVPALVSPGERYLPPQEVQKVAKGLKNPMEAGEKIPGKPRVGGAKNSYSNDTVKKTLDEGGIVLPRSVTQSKNPHWEAHKFVRAIMAKNGGKIG